MGIIIFLIFINIIATIIFYLIVVGYDFPKFFNPLIALLFLIIITIIAGFIQNKKTPITFNTKKTETINKEINYIKITPEMKVLNLCEEEQFEYFIEGINIDTQQSIVLQNLKYEYYGLSGNQDLIEIIEPNKSSDELIKKIVIKRKRKPKEKEFISFSLNIISDNANPNTLFFHGNAGE